MNLFKQLHRQVEPLLIGNVWDVASARVAESLGFKAIGTSSAAIANMLGYEDGEQMEFNELLTIVRRILACCSLPLTVDIEGGYSDDPSVTADYIKQLAEIGVVGVNIEDSKVREKRELLEASQFAGKLSAIKAQLAKDNVDIFINVRTDPFAVGHEEAPGEAQRRARLYEAAGADGLFVPCITNVEDIRGVVAATSLPVNVMCMPELPTFVTLASLGVKRISMGNFLFDAMHSDLKTRLEVIQQTGSFSPVF